MPSDADARDYTLIQGRVLGVPLSIEDHGKCFSCGFLSRTVRSALATSHKEIDWYGRFGLEPLLGTTVGEFRRTGSEEPHIECFRHVVNLADEIGLEMGSRGGNDWDAARHHILWKDRHCPEWFLYSPGMDPPRHFDRCEMQQLEQSRRQYEADQERDRRAFEERMESERRAFDERLQAQSSKLSNGLIIAALILGFFQLLAAFVAMTRDSMFMKWWLGQ